MAPQQPQQMMLKIHPIYSTQAIPKLLFPSSESSLELSFSHESSPGPAVELGGFLVELCMYVAGGI